MSTLPLGQSLLPLMPAPPPDPATERALQQQFNDATTRPGIFQGAVDAANSEWSLSWAYRALKRTTGSLNPEPGFNIADLDKTRFEALTTGLDPSLWSPLSQAVSWDHAMSIRDGLMSVQQSRSNLAKMGWRGSALMIGANILDPTNIAIAAATAGAGTPVSVGGRVSRLATFARSGLINGTANAAFESYLASEDPTRGVDDVLYAFGSGFLLGGAIDAALAGPRLRRLQKAVEYKNTLDAAMGAAGSQEFDQSAKKMLDDVVTTRGKDYFTAKDVQNPAVASAERAGLEDPAELANLRKAETAADHGYRDPTPDELSPEISDPSSPPPPPPAPDGGAVEPPEPPRKIEAGDYVLGNVSDSTAAMSYKLFGVLPVRFGMVSQLGSEEASPLMRQVSQMAEDVLNRTGDVPSAPSATMWVRRQYNAVTLQYERAMHEWFSKWFERSGRNSFQKWSSLGEFYDAVGRAIRSGAVADESIARSFDENVVGAAKAQQSIQQRLLDMARRHQVKGFDKVENNPNYLMRSWNTPRLHKLITRLSDMGIDNPREWIGDFIGRALVPLSDNLTPEAASRIGRGFVKRLLKLGEDTDLNISRAFDDPEILARILREEGDLSEEQIQSLVYQITGPPDPNRGVPNRAKRRLQLHERYGERLDDGTLLRIDDLLQGDAQALFHIYSRQILGHSAMAQWHKWIGERVGRKVENWSDVANALSEDAAKYGLIPADPKFQSQLRKMELLYKSVLGQRVVAAGDWDEWGRRLRATSYLINSGTFGLAQVPEIGTIVGEAGFHAMTQRIPAMGELFSVMKTGKANSELIGTLENFGIVWNERMTHQVVDRFDSFGMWQPMPNQKADKILGRATNIASDLSGMGPVNAFLQRLSGVAGTQKIVNQAFAAKPPSAKRLGYLKLTLDDWNRLAPAIRENVVRGEGGRVIDININAMDPVLGSKLVTALDVWSHSALQANDIGQMSAWMVSPIGRILIQFRGFAVSAWEVQLLRRVQRADFDSFMAVMMSTLVGSLVYAGQQYTRSLQADDPQAYREEKLAPGQIALAGFQRGGYSSLLPGMIETFNLGGDPIFSARNTELATGFIGGNPVISILSNTERALNRNIRSIRDREDRTFSRQDFNAARQLLPYQRAWGVKQILDAIAHRLPDEPRTR